MSDVRYPNVHVQLSGEDGNAFFIISRARRALKKAKIPDDEINAFIDGCMNQPSYSALLLYMADNVETS